MSESAINTQWYLELQEEMLLAQLRVVRRRLSRYIDGRGMKNGHTQIGIVNIILKNSPVPLHVQDIIKIAKEQYNVTLLFDSIPSMLLKKCKYGDIIKTGKNTFTTKR